MLQHAVYMRPQGQHDVPKQIIHALQRLVVSPGIQAALSFALSHLPVAHSSSTPSGQSYELPAQHDLELNNMARQRTAYSDARRRATVLAAVDNVRTTLACSQDGCTVGATLRTTACSMKYRCTKPCGACKGSLRGSSQLQAIAQPHSSQLQSALGQAPGDPLATL